MGVFEEVIFNLKPKELGVSQEKNWKGCTKERDACIGCGNKKMLDEFEKLKEGQDPGSLELCDPSPRWSWMKQKSQQQKHSPSGFDQGEFKIRVTKTCAS